MPGRCLVEDKLLKRSIVLITTDKPVKGNNHVKHGVSETQAEAPGGNNLDLRMLSDIRGSLYHFGCSRAERVLQASAGQTVVPAQRWRFSDRGCCHGALGT